MIYGDYSLLGPIKRPSVTFEDCVCPEAEVLAEEAERRAEQGPCLSMLGDGFGSFPK